MSASELHEQAAKVAEATNNLMQEVSRLRGDIARLHARFGPPKEPEWVSDPLLPFERFKNFKEALDGIATARKYIQGCEYHLGAIRGLIDGIASDAVSRQDMKQWLKDK